MKILLTGITGFLGGRIAEVLSKEHQIIGIGRNSEKLKVIEKLGIRVEKGDLSNVQFVNSVLSEEFDICIHTAALSSPWGKFQSFYSANVLATKNLVNASHNKVRRFIHISSPSIYSAEKNQHDINEDKWKSNGKFINFYAQTKYESEQVVKEIQCPYFILRPRALLGRGDTVIFPRIINAYNQGRLRRISNYNPLIDVSSVANVVQAVEQCISSEKTAEDQIYNITNGTPIRFWDVVEYALEVLGLDTKIKTVPHGIIKAYSATTELLSKASFYSFEPAITEYGIRLLKYDLTMDISKARRLLHYEPRITTETSIKEFVNWWKSNH